MVPITGHTNALNWQRVRSMSWQVLHHTQSLLDCLTTDKYPVLKPFICLKPLFYSSDLDLKLVYRMPQKTVNQQKTKMKLSEGISNEICAGNNLER